MVLKDDQLPGRLVLSLTAGNSQEPAAVVHRNLLNYETCVHSRGYSKISCIGPSHEWKPSTTHPIPILGDGFDKAKMDLFTKMYTCGSEIE